METKRVAAKQAFHPQREPCLRTEHGLLRAAKTT